MAILVKSENRKSPWPIRFRWITVVLALFITLILIHPMYQQLLYLPNFVLILLGALFFASVFLFYTTAYLTDLIRDKQKQIEDLSSARFDFMNVVMHEVKNPLTSIMGYSDLLNAQKLGPVAETQRGPLSVIKRQSHRMLDMVNDLLNLTRLELGKTKIEKKPVNLADVAGRVAEEIGPEINSNNFTLVQEFDAKTPYIRADENKITEVLINLLSNAIKFSEPGGKIFLSISQVDGEVMVSVRDEGSGIEPRDLPHIFEKFYRAGKESAERKGTGLGLAICKSIVEAHGGRMWAVSAGRGQGSVFYFTLPL